MSSEICFPISCKCSANVLYWRKMQGEKQMKTSRTILLVMLIMLLTATLSACDSDTEVDEPDATPHMLAVALTDFFATAVTPPMPTPDEESHWHRDAIMPYSTHAVLVDIDGNGTIGVLASKWTDDWYSYFTFSMPNPAFVQRLFYIYDNRLQSAETRFTVTPGGLLVLTDEAGMSGMNFRAYSLLGLINGTITPRLTFGITQWWPFDDYGWIPNADPYRREYMMTYYQSRVFERDWEQDIPLTGEQFHDLLAQHGLTEVLANAWLLPDETASILAMTRTDFIYTEQAH